MRIRIGVILRALLLLTLLAVGPALPAASPDPERTAARVDLLLAEETFGTSAEGLQRLAPNADDTTLLRRVSLDLIGRVPTPQEVTLFALDPDPAKQFRLVNRLLDDHRFGQNWASYWRDVILYRRSEERALVSARAVDEYLAGEFNANRPWNEVASAFITATGDVRTDGSTALIMAQAGRPEDTVAEISRIFMGIQIQCAQCHDHPYDDWKREEFHQLAAFFPRVAVRPDRGKDIRTFVVVGNDLPVFRRRRNASNRFRGTPEHYMPDLANPEARGELMQPVLFATGQSLDNGVTDEQRRTALAGWITSADNEWFAKAYVNRMWSELVGEGFYEPVDDLGPDRDYTAPHTLAYLAQEFANSDFDVKWLMRTIMATDAYRRESRSRRDYGETAFTANRSQRLRADQLLNVLLAALDIDEGSLLRGNGTGRARGGPRAAFNLAFGYDPSERRDQVSGSITQALAMMNSTAINSAIRANRPGGLGNLLSEIDDDRTLVSELYLRSLAREPTTDELRTCLMCVRDAGRREEAFEDILWSLINSTEFLQRR